MSALYPSQPRKSAEEILGIQATPRRSAEEILGLTPSPSLTPIPFDEFTKRVGLRATAICADGAYSFSANRRGSCSHHGGVRRINNFNQEASDDGDMAPYVVEAVHSAGFFSCLVYLRRSESLRNKERIHKD